MKLVDDEITGRVAEETDDTIRIVTTEAEYLEIDRAKVLENRRMEPGVCALNNLRGCNAGIFLTLRVTFQAYALALVLGLIFGLMRVQTNPVLYAFSTLYVEVVRGIPLLVILLYAGFVVSPELRDNVGISLNDEQEAVIGLAFGYGAFIAEIFRAGIQSISRGQMEAARSLGMSYPQAMRYVVLPQAVRVVLPPLGNDFIAMLKDSALISVLALPDLLQLGRLYVSRTFRAFEGYNTVAILYLLMTLFLSMLVRIIERRTRLPH
ncbi:MAG: amino acid ABC transporter permease [Anaerolineae bacterium]